MKFKTPITYYGGKQMLSATILPLIPEHTTYVEPFFGGGAVFFAKPKSKVEIINDLDREVINFYSQAASNFDALRAKIISTPHSRAMYKDAFVIYHNPHLFSELDRAWAFYVSTNQGFSGKIGSWGFGTSTDSCEKKLHNQRLAFSEEIKNRLDRTQIECSDAVYLIGLRDTPDTFFYVDPPYYNSNCGHYGGYTLSDYERLLDTLSKIQGKFLLSSYPSDVLDRFRDKFGWHQISLQKTRTASQARKSKTEVLTSNYRI